MKLFGKRNYDFKEYEELIIECFKRTAIQAVDDYHAASDQYFQDDHTRQKLIVTPGPESIYMLALHIMSRITEYHIEVTEGSRASGVIGASLFDWVGFAGSTTRPQYQFSQEDVKALPRDTKDRSAAYHNNVLSERLLQKPAIISSKDYLLQKAIPCFKDELAVHLSVASAQELDEAFIAAMTDPLYELHKELDAFTNKNQIKRLS